MERQSKPTAASWLLLLLSAALVAAGGLAARQTIARWTRRQLVAQETRRIRELAEPQAVARLQALENLDAEAIGIVVPVLADQRETVAIAAARTLSRLVDRWRHLRTDESSPRVAALASELAAIAPRMAPDRRRWAHDLATRLLVWPLDEPFAASGQTWADCESILRLPLAEEPEIRLAAVPDETPQLVDVPPAEPFMPELPATLPAAAEPAAAEPRFYGRPLEPGRLIDASRERPVEPQQLLPPRAMKIEG